MPGVAVPKTLLICIPDTLELEILSLPTVICILVAWNFERLLPGTISTSFWALQIISDVLEACSFLFILFIPWTDDIFHRISCQLLVLYTLWTFQHHILQVWVEKLPKNRVHNLVPSVYKFRIHLLPKAIASFRYCGLWKSIFALQEIHSCARPNIREFYSVCKSFTACKSHWGVATGCWQFSDILRPHYLLLPSYSINYWPMW